MAKYLSLIPLRHPLTRHVLLIALALFLATLNHKQGATQSGQEKTPGGDTQCQGLLQFRNEWAQTPPSTPDPRAPPAGSHLA